MKTFVLSPAGKQPIKIASHIELGKKKSGNAISAIFSAIAKKLKKAVSIQKAATAMACISAIAAWFAAIIYYATESASALFALSISSLLGILSLAPIFFGGKFGDTEI